MIPEARRLLLVVLCIFVESLQVLIIAAIISNFFPLHNEYLFSISFPKRFEHLKKTDRQLQLYQLFVLTNIIFAASFVAWWREKLKSEQWVKGMLVYTITQAIFVAVQLFAVFKITVYRSPAWAVHLLFIGLGLGILTRTFWPAVSAWVRVLYQRLTSSPPKSRVMRSFDVLVIFVIVGLLYVPDLDKVFSRVFLWSRLTDWDRYLAGPGWAFLNGVSLNKEALSPWGVVAPSLIACLSDLFGGFDYMHLMACCMALVIIYLSASYLFLRLWLKSALLSFGGVLLIIKLHLFNSSTAPLIWLYPQKTCLRYLPDLFVLTALVQYNQKNNSKWLWLASIGTGISLGYMLDTGFALLLAFYSYLVFLFLKFKLPKFLGLKLLVTPWLVALGMLELIQGAEIFDLQFWQNTFEPAFRLSQGLGAVPFYDCLRGLQFFAFVMAFIIPGVYVMTILTIGALCYFDRIPRRHFMAAIISSYGLGIYLYYLWQSSLDNYYAVALPFVLVLCFWLKQVLDYVSPGSRKLILMAWVAFNLGGLMTNQLFVYYPNVFNVAGYDWSSEKKLTQDNFNFTVDADLIKKDTAADQGVVLISSFETEILMKAQRKSFFKWVPLINSVHMSLPQFGGTAIETSDELQGVLQQLEQSKPERVFVEKKLITGQLPSQYYQYYQSLTILLEYVQQHYALENQGQYLLELKRK